MDDELLTFLSQSIPILQSLSWLHITSLVFLMFWEITIQQIWSLISGHNKGSKAYVQTSSPPKKNAPQISQLSPLSLLWDPGVRCIWWSLAATEQRTHPRSGIQSCVIKNFVQGSPNRFLGDAKQFKSNYRFDFPRPWCAIRSTLLRLHFGLSLLRCKQPTHPYHRRFYHVKCQVRNPKAETLGSKTGYFPSVEFWLQQGDVWLHQNWRYVSRYTKEEHLASKHRIIKNISRLGVLFSVDLVHFRILYYNMYIYI